MVPGPGLPTPSPALPATSGALGLVVTPGPGSWVELAIDGLSLVGHALVAMRRVPGLEVRVLGEPLPPTPGVEPDRPWRELVTGPLVLHDAACPLLSAGAVEAAIKRQTDSGPNTVVVGVRPITDTLKQVADGVLVGTVDRESVIALASPVVVGPGLLDALAAQLPRAGQLADLTAVLAALPGCERLSLEVPFQGRRLGGPDDVLLIECLHALS